MPIRDLGSHQPFTSPSRDAESGAQPAQIYKASIQVLDSIRSAPTGSCAHRRSARVRTKCARRLCRAQQ